MNDQSEPNQCFTVGELRFMVNRCQRDGQHLTKWENDFLFGMAQLLKVLPNDGKLSELQVKTTYGIYTRKTPL